MSTIVKMPQLGESVVEGTVARWLKGTGDRVAKNEALLEISTDKIDTEVPAPADGVLLEIVLLPAPPYKPAPCWQSSAVQLNMLRPSRQRTPRATWNSAETHATPMQRMALSSWTRLRFKQWPATTSLLP